MGESVHKKIPNGALVILKRSGDIGIVISVYAYWGSLVTDPYCYSVLVNGVQVKAYGEGLTIVGEP